MTTQQKAVIIGLWRMGAVIEQMCFVLKTPAYKIEKQLCLNLKNRISI